MTIRFSGSMKTILVAFLFLTTTSAHAVFAQAEGHSSIEIDFGVLSRDGSCDISTDEYMYDTDGMACLLVEYQTSANARFNLSLWSDSYPDFDLERVELIVTPGTQSVYIVALNLVIPDDMSYGESRLLVRVDDWNDISGGSPVPIVNSDDHKLILQQPGYELEGEFRYGSHALEIPQSADMGGVVTSYNYGGAAFSVRPVLLQTSNVISSSDSYSIGPGEISDRRASFSLPDSLNVGTHYLQVALQDLRKPLATYLWKQDVEVTITHSSGSVDTLYALWDLSSFDGPSSLGTYSDDVVDILINQTNPGSLAATSDIWVNFVSGDECFPVYIGMADLEAGETTTSSFPVEIPRDLGDGTILDAGLASSGCSMDPIVELEQISVFDRPTSISAIIHANSVPYEFNGNNVVPISFSVTNLEDHEVSGLGASVTLYAMGRNLGEWSGQLSLEGSQTNEFHVELSTPYCYDGDVDASLEVRARNGELVHSSLTQNSLRAYFPKGEFDMQSELEGSGAISLGMPITIQTHVHAQTSNPSECVLLIPLMSVFSPVDSVFPPLTEISLLEINSGESVWHDLETSISASSGTYQISQHLMRSYSNGSSEDWLSSSQGFAELEVSPSSPEFIVECYEPSNSWDGSRYAMDVGCALESRVSFGTWIRVGTEIGDSEVWDKPTKIESYDVVRLNLSRPYSLGDDHEATLLVQVLWDGEWLELLEEWGSFEMQVNDELDGSEPFPYEGATTHPPFPRGGDPFAVHFRAIGSSAWVGGSYEVRVWLDPSKEGAAYASPRLSHGLGVGDSELVEVGFEEWPDTCGTLPYEIVARDSGGAVLDKIESKFDGCSIDLIDLSVIGQLDIIHSSASCIATMTVANKGTRDYAPATVADQADVTLIVDGKIVKSSVSVPPLGIGEEVVLEVGVPISGFQDLRMVLDGDMKYSDLDRHNNGLGWASAHGPIVFENDSDFDGLSNEFELAGYTIRTITSKSVLTDLILFLEDPSNNDAPVVQTRRVFPDPTKHDSDNDGLSDYLEWVIGSDARRADTDGDNYPDLEEYESGNQDPLMMELEAPVIRASAPIQTRNSIFEAKHTRSLYIEDRNFDFATVTIAIGEDTETFVLENFLLASEGDIHHFSITYNYSLIDTYSVTVTAYDEFDNVAVLEIASQDTVWERVTNKISSFATSSLIEALGPIIGPGVLGLLTGLVYGIKDIVDLVTGIVPLLKALWAALEGALSAVYEIVIDCVPESFLSEPGEPLRIPGDCLLVGLDMDDIARGLSGAGEAVWKAGGQLKSEFIGLSPYDNGSAEQRTFLGFTVIGFLAIQIVAGVLFVKGVNAARTVSGTVDDIASGLGKTKEAVLGTMSSALARSGTGLKAGAQSSVLSKFPPSATGASIGNAYAAVGAVKAGKVALGDIGDAYKLIGKAKSRPSAYAKLMDDPHGFEILKHKETWANNDKFVTTWDEVLDHWIMDDVKVLCLLKKSPCNNFKIDAVKGYGRERMHTMLTGEKGFVIPKASLAPEHQHLLRGADKRQLDMVWARKNDDGIWEWGDRELKQCNDPIRCTKKDNLDKSVPLSRSEDGDMLFRAMCDKSSFEECYSILKGRGMSDEMADGFAGCITNQRPCADYKSIPDINDLETTMWGVGCMDRPGACKDIANGEWKPEIKKGFSECADRASTIGSLCSDMPSREALDAACPSNNFNCLKASFPSEAESLRQKFQQDWIESMDSATDIVGPIMNPMMDEFAGIGTYTAQSGLVFPVEQSKPFVWGALWATVVAASVTLSLFVIGARVVSNRN